MVRPRRPRAAPALLVTAVLLAGGACGRGVEGERTIEIDLTEPRTPSQLAPDTRTNDMATIEGPADFTVLLPARTIAGRFRAVNVYGDIVLDDTIAPDDPSLAVRSVDLRYEFTNDADEVLARLDRVIADFDVSGDDRAALVAFAGEIRSATDARGGEIVAADFELPTGSNIHRFGVAATDADDVELQVRFLEGGDVAMTLFVAFDNG